MSKVSNKKISEFKKWYLWNLKHKNLNWIQSFNVKDFRLWDNSDAYILAKRMIILVEVKPTFRKRNLYTFSPFPADINNTDFNIYDVKDLGAVTLIHNLSEYSYTY